jgi:hypothetical protein
MLFDQDKPKESEKLGYALAGATEVSLRSAWR